MTSMDCPLRKLIRPGLHCSSRADILSETCLQTRTLCTNIFSGQAPRLQCTGEAWSVTQTFLLQSIMAGRWLGSSMRWTGCHFHQLQRRSLSLFTAPAKKKKNCVRGKCTCKVYELPCTNLCKCTHCDNNILEEA